VGGSVALESGGFPRNPARVAVTGRSILGVMTFLAQLVEVPPEHLRQGLAHETRGKDGSRFDWNEIANGMFRIHSSKTKPSRTFLEVYYRDHWFYIDDADIESKSTYTLLAQLFSLQSASGGQVQAPVLTIPTLTLPCLQGTMKLFAFLPALMPCPLTNSLRCLRPQFSREKRMENERMRRPHCHLTTLAAGSVALLAALTAVDARAAGIIKNPGDHPKYAVELEPHGLLDWDNYWWGGTGYGLGMHAVIPFLDNGPVSTINNNMGIGFRA
jgi:hypothetical protein